MTDTGKRLNLKWVAETIGDEYKNWRKGDIVLLNAQTGTGKTWFIENVLLDYIEDYKNVLLVSNRTNLKRQIKKDLLEKYNLEIPESLEELDKITKIYNVVITSYHAIQDSELDKDYNVAEFKGDLNFYDYIVLDEAHYILSDGSFNNKTRIVLDELIRDYHRQTIKIFISATMDEIKKPIYNYVDKIIGKKPKIHNYTTGIDYSYVNTNYFRDLDSIIATIKNDTTNDKWLVFVSKIDDAKEIEKELGQDKCTIIKSGTKSEELTSIINNSKFESKVLIATKTLDNGINIKDDQLKNIVIMAWDKITFVQMLGRKRIEIENAQQINLYIMTRYKKSFSQKIINYNKKLDEVELYKNNENEFNRKYDNDLWKIGKNLNELFYRSQKNGNWKLNKGGYYRLIKDIKFAAYMVNKFEEEGEFAFITEQLSWLELGYTFDEMNLIEDVVLNEDVMKLEDYLESIIGKKLFGDEQQKLSDLIIGELITVKNKIDYRTKKIKPSTLESILREQLSLPYAVSKSTPETKGEMRNKKYIIITKIVDL
ncbi:hypothetical protein DCCM_0453 [Desulfocucumis palustris]|uniref:DEAD/DEAH box helicase n=1 Tax=Desulfocucumis palustris TaxID=1898651 RepID=A0A2L2X8B2_9FIRM|nr:DEAD/DEAH box helicase [Desulfocucumis palustris]GBF32260.1 hypothetical protein DCCM_0453 [Desulfocucumis palustris]